MTRNNQTLELTSPFIDIELNAVPEHWKAIIALWMTFWAVAAIGLLYLYAFVLPEVWGFESVVLLGIGFIALTVSANG